MRAFDKFVLFLNRKLSKTSYQTKIQSISNNVCHHSVTLVKDNKKNSL